MPKANAPDPAVEPKQEPPVIPPTPDAPKPAPLLTPQSIAAPRPPGEVPANIPTVKLPEPASIRYLGQPPENESYKGSFVNRMDGEKYALATLPEKEVENKKTHFAKNNVHFWNGTEAEFRELFDKA